jgi:hypothetical protein
MLEDHSPSRLKGTSYAIQFIVGASAYFIRGCFRSSLGVCANASL